MFNSIKESIGQIFDWFDALKGQGVIVKQYDDAHPGACFQVETTGGFGFKIYCKQKRFKAVYRMGIVLSLSPIYEVRCECDDKTPDVLKQRLEKTMAIPETSFFQATVSRKKQNAINVFLRIIIDDLKINR